MISLSPKREPRHDSVIPAQAGIQPTREIGLWLICEQAEEAFFCL
jgi:hypothetical protein